DYRRDSDDPRVSDAEAAPRQDRIVGTRLLVTSRSKPMRIVILGGTGHIGTYLIPRLAAEGHEVLSVSRGQRQPYQPHGAWKQVRQITLDRGAEEAGGVFGGRIRDLQPDVVVDMICFTLESAQQLVEALEGHIQHFLHCGTIWVHG